MPRSFFGLAATICLCSATMASAAMTCAISKPDMLAGFTPLDPLAFLDLPDPFATRATAALEDSFVDQLVREDIRSFTKAWCEIGLQTMVVEFDVPVEDDAIVSILTRAIYIWDAQADPAGWRIDVLGERSVCARGTDPFAAICP